MTQPEITAAARYCDEQAKKIGDRIKAQIVAGTSPAELAGELERVSDLLELADRLDALAART